MTEDAGGRMPQKNIPELTIVEQKPSWVDEKQGLLNLGISANTEVNGIGMGVLSDGTPFLNQRGLAALCGVKNAHIGTISSQWSEMVQKPRIRRVKDILENTANLPLKPHIEVQHNGVTQYCYPAEICLAVLEYYAFDAGNNCQPEARDNFRKLAGSKLKDLIYTQVGYSPEDSAAKRFEKWHERIALNFKAAPRGFFHVFNETSTIIYELIAAGAPVDERTIVDISVGQHWAKFWSENELCKVYGRREKYPHNYPDSHPQSLANPHFSWCYPNAALGAFREWLQEEYIEGGKFKNYLKRKESRGLIQPSIVKLALEAVSNPALPAA